MAINENSADPQVAAIAGDNSAGGDGVIGTGRRGVVGGCPGFVELEVAVPHLRPAVVVGLG